MRSRTHPFSLFFSLVASSDCVGRGHFFLCSATRSDPPTQTAGCLCHTAPNHAITSTTMQHPMHRTGRPFLPSEGPTCSTETGCSCSEKYFQWWIWALGLGSKSKAIAVPPTLPRYLSYSTFYDSVKNTKKLYAEGGLVV